MNPFRLIIISYLACCFLIPLQGFSQQQEFIVLSNASFEQNPRAGEENGPAPKGWYDCGMPGETPPDIHPGPIIPFFGVRKKAHHGSSYLGLVVRSNETYEGIGQRLRQPLEAGKTYTIVLHLAQSPTYLSPAKRGSDELTNYNQPIKVRLWGGNGYCKKGELLAESKLINHADWRKYTFTFTPKKKHTYFRLDAFWKTPVLVPYRGNVLVDNISPIYIEAQDEPLADESPEVVEAPKVKILSPAYHTIFRSEDNTTTVTAKIANIRTKRKISFFVNDQPSSFTFDVGQGMLKANIPLSIGNNTIRIKASNESGTSQDEVTAVYSPKENTTPVPPPTPEVYVHNPELANKVVVGQKIKISNLNFAANSYEIKPEAYSALDEFATYLRSHPSVKVEVGGHTNNRCREEICNELSKNRAKAVVDYLVSRGVPSEKLTYKGYGSSEPIANNKYLAGREKNQRVEIKIL